MKDRYDRDINYLRIAITDKCNLMCMYCRPEMQNESADILSAEELERLARVFAGCGINKIRLTGGEPLVRSDIVEVVRRISSIEGLKDFAMTTNGIYLKKYASELKKAGLKRVNISIDSLDERKYAAVTGGGELKEVLDGIDSAFEAGLLPVKLNVVLMGGFNDNEVRDFIGLTEKRPVEVRFIELMPVGKVTNWAREKFISKENILQAFPELIPDKAGDSHSTAEYYKSGVTQGRIGFISAISCSFCADCSRLRLTADGKLRPCLHSDIEFDMKGPLREGGDLNKVILEAIQQKPSSHRLGSNVYASRNMVNIGG